MIEILHRKLKEGLRARNSHSREDQDLCIHASDIPNLCIRKHLLVRTKGIRVAQEIPDTATMLTWEIGRQIEEIVLGALQEASANHGSATPTVVVPKVKLAVPLPARFTLTCEIDIGLAVNGIYHVLEVKSIKVPGEKVTGIHFDNITEAMIDHGIQAQTYLWALEKNKKKKGMKKWNTKTAYVVYVAKGYRQNPFRIFPVHRNEVANARMEGIIKELKKFEETGEILPRGCTTKAHPLSKKCGVARTCFL